MKRWKTTQRHNGVVLPYLLTDEEKQAYEASPHLRGKYSFEDVAPKQPANEQKEDKPKSKKEVKE